MKRFFLLASTLAIITACGSGKTTTSQTETTTKTTIVSDAVASSPQTYAATITSNELKELLYTYASDEFEGRETGKPGQKKAIEYLKQQYIAMDMESPLKGDNYFQEVPLAEQKTSVAMVTINGQSYEAFDDHIVALINESVDINANEVVYVGYGIDAENYSNYKGVDVKGKIVLAKPGEPVDANGNYVTTGTTDPSKWTSGRQAISSKRNAALDNGAAIFIYTDDNLFPRYSAYFRGQYESGAAGRLSLNDSDDSMLMLMTNSKLAKALHPDIDTDDSSKVINTEISVKAENKSSKVVSENVVAFIKGSEKPDEIIVVSSHLDHIGVSAEGQVNNGADDDGSGTVAVVEIAEAFKVAQLAGNGPKRSLLFLHVTGEEKGLLGSRYYTDIEPLFPLENTVANLNIDMIGRVDPKREGDRNYVYLIGSDKLSTELHTISEEVNSKYCNVELDYTYNDENDPNRFYYRSDHYNFAKNNIPVIFYFNGTHADYHRPSDTPDKIEYDLLENRARLVFYTAWELANRDDRIVVDKAVE
ncbi:M28 family peptidase [Winogradskyella aurantiaca]|uniref:M28 family peptidase n=1 Tax=Winogradskyella aurantiaca TaxID=2219558 RepID=UPI000E1DB05F|nr:M28 family peptidase [Winogradskyella aurantiaca]